jgi:hypothetical protein
MTEIVEKVTITMTMNHDMVKTSMLYGGDVNLEDWICQAWDACLPWFRSRRPLNNIQIIIAGGAVKVDMRYGGLDEVPESTGGDN